MKKNKLDNTKLNLTGLGFKQAFKATCGFYLAQMLMSFLGLITFLSVLASIVTVVYYLFK